MAKMVGLSRNLKLQWLNKVVELVLEDLAEDEIKAQLNEYLSFEITSYINIRKTREILMNIWVYENDYSNRLRAQALTLIRNCPKYAIEIHWCMILASYPVFIDMCKFFGKMAEFQDEVTLTQLKQKLFDEWGERATLFHSIDKLIATLKELNVVVCDKPGKYHINRHKVNNVNIASFMVYTMMCVDDGGYYSFIDLRSSTYFFPFEYQIEKEKLLEDDRFAMNNFGGELTIALKDSI
jgi:hypothetical protein